MSDTYTALTPRSFQDGSRPSRRSCCPRDTVRGFGRAAPIDRDSRSWLYRRVEEAGRSRLANGERVIRTTAEPVFKALLSFANFEDGRCFPGHSSIAERANVSVRTVQRSLSDLEAVGVLTWSRRLRAAPAGSRSRTYRTTNVYRFAVRKPTADDYRPARPAPRAPRKALVPDPVSGMDDFLDCLLLKSRERREAG